VKALTANEKPKELFFSSDLCAIVEHTKNYAAIEDNEIVHIKVNLFLGLGFNPVYYFFVLSSLLSQILDLFLKLGRGCQG
jgi:hypothetical protein